MSVTTVTTDRRRVAVIGSGVSGLVAAHLLGREDHVTLYEADDRLGGHADTHEVATPEGPVAIDTGFIVHNERTYPTLLAIFDELGVPTQESDMSMSVRDERNGLEFAGALGARGLFPTWRNALNPRYLRMLVEIVLFHRRARALLSTESGADDRTLAAFLSDGRFSAYFRKHFMTPLVACVWSCDPEVALDYPARYLFRFLEHHGMLTVFGSPTWRTVTGGSREYVRRVAAGIAEVRLETKVVDVQETAEGVIVTDGDGDAITYDAVVIATHPDQALGMLAEASPVQRELLSAMRYSDNLAQLHTDTRLLPEAHNARASWNYQRRAEDDGRVLVTYDLSRLMRLPGYDEHAGTRYLVTLNGSDIVDPHSVIATREYSHPIYDPESVAAQARLPEINTARIAFAGAYHGWGFHEDGALSGLKAAEHLGATGLDTPEPAARALDQRQTPEPAARALDQRETPEPAARALDQRPAGVAYATTVSHSRTAPLRNAFTYRSRSWLVDLDQLPTGLTTRFEARDHVGDPNRSIRENIEALLAEHDIDLAGGRILMLTQPRSLGHAFNPITVFWCDDADGRQAAVVVEVHNTYGGRHAYVVHPDEDGRATVGKELYVSPFNDTSGRYDVVVTRPGRSVSVSVTLRREGQPPFVATMRGRAVRGAHLRPTLAGHLVSARIRRQGITLWLRRLPVQARPQEHR